MKPNTPAAGRMHSYFGAAQRKCQHPLRLAYSARRGMMILLVDVTPGSGPAYTLLAFVIVIVGGLGSMSGALVGGVLIGISEAFGGLFIAPSAKSMETSKNEP